MSAIPRVVTPEILDALAEADPAAQRSRRDLRRVHRVMGSRAIVLRALRGAAVPALAAAPPLRVLELGAGDGSLMLGVAGRLRGDWPAVELTLLDRQNLVSAATVERYAGFGWTARPRVVDALAWAASETHADDPTPPPRWHLVIANLFLHHFEGATLAALLRAVAGRCDCFFACEPRRAALPLAASRLVGLIGANAVTRADAVASVRAGFRGCELGGQWPVDAGAWALKEYADGLFSHCLLARRGDAGPPLMAQAGR